MPRGTPVGTSKTPQSSTSTKQPKDKSKSTDKASEQSHKVSGSKMKGEIADYIQKYYKDNANFQYKIRTVAELMSPQFKAQRHPTHLTDLDKMLGGGLPPGVVLLEGDAGHGKSRFAKSIVTSYAKNGGKCIYVCAESYADFRDENKQPFPDENVYKLDYIRFRPTWKAVVGQIMGFAEEIRPDLIVIDSLTDAFGETKKAVGEADL